jgi:hypothetical protein
MEKDAAIHVRHILDLKPLKEAVLRIGAVVAG